MRFIRQIAFVLALALALLQPGEASRAAPIRNTAQGTVNGVVLDPAAAEVELNRVGSVVTRAVAEILPNQVITGRTGESFSYHVMPTIRPGDTGIERVEIEIPPDYTNAAVTNVHLDRAPLSANCPAVPGEYCATLAGNTLTIVLGSKIVTDNAPIRIEFTADTPAAEGTVDFTSVVADGPMSQATTVGNADGDPANANSISVEALQSQGLVLEMVKSANKTEAIVGEVVTYVVTLANDDPALDVVDVIVEDLNPLNFKYIPGSARLNGAPLPDEPTGNRPLEFAVGTVPALIDGNANGQADPGEQGFVTLVYQLVISSGATPGAYENVAVAKDYCDACLISNSSKARVEVMPDEFLDLGTIIGKVFEDKNRNDWQDPDEPGVPDAMVALDDGTYILTDAHGRYHIPVVEPGYRMLKINLHSLPPGTVAATEKSRLIQVTPGLMVRVNFGVVLPDESQTIGRPGEQVLALSGAHEQPPVDVRGNVESLSALVNGERVHLPSGNVRLGLDGLDESVQFEGSNIGEPIVFELGVAPNTEVEGWDLEILDDQGLRIRAFDGDGAPPLRLEWDGTGQAGEQLVAGEIYQYQLTVRYADGSAATSPRRLFGVNRNMAFALHLLGEAFQSGQDSLSPKAKETLRETASVLQRFPDEKVVVEGHTDSVGSNEANLDLSRRRAQAAAAFLVGELGIPDTRIALSWHGEERPVATNDLEEGRALNRRVEIRGELEQTDDVRIVHPYRTGASARINGAEIELRSLGRFSSKVEPGADGKIGIELTDSQGRSAAALVSVPELKITAPQGSFLVPRRTGGNGCEFPDSATEHAAAALVCTLIGTTQPDNALELNGRPISVAPDGSFQAEVPVTLGDNVYGLVARNKSGYARLANLMISAADRDERGHYLTSSDAIPNLTVHLPPEGIRLSEPEFELRGQTDPYNRITVNGQSVEVDAEGFFSTTVTLPFGRSRLSVEARDPQDRVGTIDREIEVAKHQLFLLAFADGKFGRMKTEGVVQGSDAETDEYYSEGRLAFYLKGRIAGKYLITSAFDSGRGELNTLFKNLDGDSTQELLRNLDPDRLYPVYGDTSTVVWDAQSQGKFYLALDSDTIHLLVGNYQLSFNNTELATYRRTFYGARFAYESASRTKYGDPDTQVVLFGASVERQHVQDELRATGGSVYYLSQREVVEGSEEITLVVRDKNTGLQLRTYRQRQNVDYWIKYPEGRVMFHRPIQSVVQGGTLFNEAILAGNPVFILADYEAPRRDFEKTASGGRFRQQIGDHVAVGGTYVQDAPESGSYELAGVDAELRLGKGTRLQAEYADSSGTDSTIFVSDDGGLTYTEAPANGAREGNAWKAAAELDIGEWFKDPGKYKLRLYMKELEPGFSSNGNFMEQGTRKSGASVELNLTAADTLQLSHDVEKRLGGGLLDATGKTTLNTAQWRHTKERWGVAAEYFSIKNELDSTAPTESSDFVLARYWNRPTDKLSARIEHQQTLSGPENNQTTLGVEYLALQSLALSMQATDGTQGRSGQLGAIYKRGDSEIYLTQRLSDGIGGPKRTMIMGARSPLGEKSRIYSEYQWESSQTGQKTMQLLGIQRQWDLAPGLRVLAGGESAKSDASSAATSRSALSAGLYYSNDRGLKAFTRQEVRLHDQSTRQFQYFTVNEIDYGVNPDLTLLGRYRYSKTEDRDLGTVVAKFDERTVGLAYRPVHNDRFHSLARYTRLLDKRPSPALPTFAPERTIDVISVDLSLRVTRRLEWLGKGATRSLDERVGDLDPVTTHSYLVIQRLNYNFWKDLDLAIEYRLRGEREFDDQRQGWLSEFGWNLFGHMRLGLGYDFTDFSDDMYSDNDYTTEGWFFRLQGRY